MVTTSIDCSLPKASVAGDGVTWSDSTLSSRITVHVFETVPEIDHWFWRLHFYSTVRKRRRRKCSQSARRGYRERGQWRWIRSSPVYQSSLVVMEGLISYRTRWKENQRERERSSDKDVLRSWNRLTKSFSTEKKADCFRLISLSGDNWGSVILREKKTIAVTREIHFLIFFHRFRLIQVPSWWLTRWNRRQTIQKTNSMTIKWTWRLIVS